MIARITQIGFLDYRGSLHTKAVMSRMPAHAKNQQARQTLEKAQKDPNCWYLPENFKKQVGC